MNNVICEHDLLHKVERHECDGCCARYILTEETEQKEKNKMDEMECGYLGFISTTDAGLQTFFAVVLTTVIVGLVAGLISSVATKNRLAKELKEERDKE